MRARFAPLLISLFLAAGAQNAEAGCAQYWEYSADYNGTVWSQIDVAFDATYGSGGWYSCGYYEELGGAGYAYAYYAPYTTIQPPNGYSGTSSYEPNVWEAHVYAELEVTGTGPGNVTVENSITEYLVEPEHGPYREDYGPWTYYFYVEGGPPDPPTVYLTASDYSPPQNSGLVTVWAWLSDPSYSNAIGWQGCSPDSGDILTCYVDTSLAGPHWVTVFLDGLQMDQILIDVQAEQQQQSGTLRLFLRRGDGSGFNPANPSGTDDAPQFEPGRSFDP